MCNQSRPTVDERHIHHAPMSREGAALQAAVPGIISSTATEATPWLLRNRANLQVTAGQLQARIQAQFGLDAAGAAQVIEGYRVDAPDRSPWDMLVAITSDAMIRTPLRRAAAERSKAGRAPVYLADFTWLSPVEGGIRQGPHGMDVPMAFGNIGASRFTNVSDAGAEEVSRNLMAAYVAFARSGTRDNGSMPHWPAYTLPTRASMVIDRACRQVNDYRSGDRRASESLSVQRTFEVTDGALVKVV